MVPPWIWTPSWSHCTSSWTTGGSSIALGGHRSPVGPPCSAIRRSLPWPSSPSGPLQKREGLLAFRLFAPAPLLPEPVFAGPAQPAHPSPGVRVAPLAARLRPRALRAFGRLSRYGHDPGAGHREGEGFSQGPLLRAGHVRQERLQDRVGPASRRRWW